MSEDGEDRGGSSFVSVTPPWFGAWMGRRDTAPREPHDLARVALTLHYARPAAAARWLAGAFGFESPNPLPEGEDPLSDDAYGFPWIEFHVGNTSFFVEPLADQIDLAQVTHVPWVFVDDLEAHHARARENGADDRAGHRESRVHLVCRARPRGATLAFRPGSAYPAALRSLRAQTPPASAMRR